MFASGAVAAPNGPMAASTGVSDDLCQNNFPHLPAAWPIMMSVIVRVPTAVPTKWQHGMGGGVMLKFHVNCEGTV